MRIPVICGTIDRRILANYRVDPDVMRRLLPAPFRPKLVNGNAIAGVCLIRLKDIRPRFFPLPWGIQSENAAHRIAVEWGEGADRGEGVYIPRRDTNSWSSVLAGGTIFPGVHNHATFTVSESLNEVSVDLKSDDGQVEVHVSGSIAERLSLSSVFNTLGEASRFFEQGALGYSATATPGRFDGLELKCQNWRVEPLAVGRISSSFFEDRQFYPPGSIEFDCALLMRGIRHEWLGRQDLCCADRGEA